MPAAMGKDRHWDAVTAYLMVGTIKGAARQTGLSEAVIRKWMKADWWEDMLAKANEAITKKQQGSFRTLLNKINKELVDRVENGDTHSFHGEQYKMPVKAKDLTYMAQATHNMLRLTEGKATTLSGKAKSVEKRLEEWEQAYQNVQKKEQA